MANEILTETTGQVGIVRINRAAALNALNQEMMGQVTAALRRFDDEPSVKCMLVAGYERAFATDDQKEGMRAHLERRPPIFAGR